MKKIFMYAVLLAVLAVFAELMAWMTIPYLSLLDVFYDKTQITQPYADYLAKRDPRLGWRPPAASTVADGTRRDPGFDVTAPPCMSLFGDSFTWGEGEGVRDEDAWGALLSHKLGCRVANFGVPGFGLDQAYLRFLDTPPTGKIVFLDHLSENILRNVNQFRNFLYPGEQYIFKPRFILDNGVLKQVPMPDIPASEIGRFLDDPAAFLRHEYFLPGGPAGIETLRRPYFVTVGRAVAENYHIHSVLLRQPRYTPFYEPRHPAQGLEITFALLQSFVKEAQARSQVPVVALMPTCRDIEYALSHGGDLPYAPLATLLRQAGQPFLDVGQEVMKSLGGASPGSLYDDCSGHFNRAGYARLADIVLAYLRARPDTAPYLKP